MMLLGIGISSFFFFFGGTLLVLGVHISVSLNRAIPGLKGVGHAYEREESIHMEVMRIRTLD